MDGRGRRNKGARGEREWRDFLRAMFPRLTACSRGARNGVKSGEDVMNGLPGTRCEVKRVERLQVHKALKQCEDDAVTYSPDGKVSLRLARESAPVPYVAHRRNNGQWMVTIYADDLVRFAEAVRKAQEDGDAA